VAEAVFLGQIGSRGGRVGEIVKSRRSVSQIKLKKRLPKSDNVGTS